MAKRAAARPAATTKPAPPVRVRLAAAMAELEKRRSKRVRDGMARYGLPSDHAIGVAVGDIQRLGKAIGRDHELAQALWATGVYEARMLTAFVGDPARVTPAQMDRWCRDFDNWGICDTLCFHLFDRTPHAFARVAPWCASRREFVRRAGFALLACLAAHDRTSGDAPFRRCLPLIERGASDERNFVKKGVSWALRGVGRRSPALHAASLALARKLAASEDATARWVGRDAIRDLTKPAVVKKLAAR
jgi:3-methyladenine DNA glycosylase AlkD